MREKGDNDFIGNTFPTIIYYKKHVGGKMYKTELHCHSKGVSPCGQVELEDIANKYIKNGYNTLVLANHFSRHSIKHVGARSMEEYVEHFFGECDDLARIARDRLCVLAAAEIRFDADKSNDYLLYGVDRSFFLDKPEILSLDIKALHAYAMERGVLIVQAHPFRNGITVTPPQHVDGIEVFNGHPGHDSRNEIAEAWAERFSLIKTSGTDFHRYHAPLDAGILTEHPITDVEVLVDTLRSGSYTLIKDIGALEAGRSTY